MHKQAYFMPFAVVLRQYLSRSHIAEFRIAMKEIRADCNFCFDNMRETNAKVGYDRSCQMQERHYTSKLKRALWDISHKTQLRRLFYE
jgi:hypothetical protein